MVPPTHASAVRRFGAFELNLHSGELRKNGLRLRLPAQAFQVLAALLEKPGEMVSREELRSKLWPADTFVDFDHGLNNAVARIREVLDDSSETPRYVETVPRHGYRFIGTVADAAPAPIAQVEVARQAPPAAVPATERGRSRRMGIFMAGAAALLSIVAAVVYIGERRTTAKQTALRSIAVLPLKNLSGDASQQYLADGLTEELIGRLAAIRNLRVISRTSIMRFQDTKLSVPEISRMLNVDAVVEGSVIRQGNRIRVHAQLIHGATDEHFWSESYDRELRDALALESDVAEAIAQKVEVTFTGQEHSRLASTRHVAPEVYENYLKGEFFLHRNTQADLEESIRYFNEAVKEDGTFAAAYLGLAKAFDQIGSVFVGGNPDQNRPNVIDAARKALALDPGLADAHVLLADTYRKQWHWSDAEAEYKQALALKPHDVAAYMGMALWLLSNGRTEEAVEWSRRARDLDPVFASSADLGWILFNARHFDDASHELRAQLAVTPDEAGVLWYLGFVLIAQGKAADAVPVLEKAVKVSGGSPGVLGVLARAYAGAGRRTDAQRVVGELKRRRQNSYVPAAAFVQAYAGLGDKEQTLAWLEEAYKEQSNLMQWLKVEPTFDFLRADPRFADLLHRVGVG